LVMTLVKASSRRFWLFNTCTRSMAGGWGLTCSHLAFSSLLAYFLIFLIFMAGGLSLYTLATSLHLEWYVPDFGRSWCYAWGPSMDWVKLL
jgi:hypothetical protein